jgi:hypothetical protein
MTRTGSSSKKSADVDVAALAGGFLGPIVVGVGGFSVFSALQARPARGCAARRAPREGDSPRPAARVSWRAALTDLRAAACVVPLRAEARRRGARGCCCGAAAAGAQARGAAAAARAQAGRRRAAAAAAARRGAAAGAQAGRRQRRRRRGRGRRRKRRRGAEMDRSASR